MTLLMIKHEKDNTALTEKVNTVKVFFESMALQFSSEEKDKKVALFERKCEYNVCNFKSEK